MNQKNDGKAGIPGHAVSDGVPVQLDLCPSDGCLTLDAHVPSMDLWGPNNPTGVYYSPCDNWWDRLGTTRRNGPVTLGWAIRRLDQKYYARAMGEKAHDPDRAKLRLKPELSLPARVEELWRIWASKHPHAAACVTSSYAQS